MDSSNEIKCVLCGAEGLHREGEVPVARLVEEWQRYFLIDVGRFFNHVPVLTTWRCGTCGLVQFRPAATGDSQLYSHLQQFNWYYLPDKWEHRRALEVLKSAEAVRVLEIGSGKGAFLKKLAHGGFQASGLELNPEAAQACREEGLDVRVELLNDFAASHPGGYDAVCSFQVLEHVEDPRGLVEDCCRVLRPGGLLILGVPDDQGLGGRGLNILNMPPHHLTKWTPAVMKYFPRLFPVRLLSQETEPLADYHIDAFLDSIRWLVASQWPGNTRAGKAVRWRLECVIRRFGLNRWFKGECLLACFRKSYDGKRVTNRGVR